MTARPRRGIWLAIIRRSVPTCSTCGGSLKSEPCTRNPYTGKGGHATGGGATIGGAA